MSMMRRSPANTRAVAVWMSFLLVILSLVPFAAFGSKAYAGTVPYTPVQEETPGYTGPLTWMNYTPPIAPGSIPGMTEFYQPYFLDIDDEDNVYVTKTMIGLTSKGKVEKISSNGQESTDISYDANLKNPIGIAVDKDGNVYVSDNSQVGGVSTNKGRILKLPHGKTSWVDITHGETFKYALGVAVDKQGNVYAVDSRPSSSPPAGTERILKLPSGKSSWANITTTPTPFSNPIDIAVDGEGNVFVSDLSTGSGKIFKRPVNGTTWTNVAPTTVSGGLPFLIYGINVDKFDNVYAMGLANSKAMKLGYNGGPSDWTVVDVMSNPFSPISNFDVAADSSGYLYTTNINTGNVVTLMAAILYDGNGATGIPPVDNTGYRLNETATVYGNTSNLAKQGYVFNGWNTKADGTGTTYAPGETISSITQSMTLYAIWSQGYTMTYIGNGDTGGSVPVDNNQYPPGVTATVKGNTGGLVKAGHTFGGWNTKADGTGITYAPGDTITAITPSMKLYAIWSQDFTMTYSGNGNTGGSVPSDNNPYPSGATASVKGNTGGLVKAGYTFVGWNTKADGTGITYAPGDTITSITQNMTLYAVWSQDYTMTYNGNGNTGGSVPVDNNPYPPGVTATVNGNTGGLVKAGYTFGGWNTKADGTGITYAPGETISSLTESMTLYAIWSQVLPDVTNATYSATPTSITLNWNNPLAAMNGIKIVDGKGAVTTSVTTHTYTFTGLTPNTPYSYKIIVLDAWNMESIGVTVRASTSAAPLPILTGLSVTPGQASLKIGETTASVVTATYSDLTSAIVTPLVAWNTDNSNVASVSTSGVITAKASGSATITGVLGNYTVTVVVTVSPAPLPVIITSLSVDPDSAQMERGEQQQLKVTAAYSNHTTADVTASSGYVTSDENIVVVNAAGILTAVGYGTAEISVSFEGQSRTVAVNVVMPNEDSAGSPGTSAPSAPAAETEEPAKPTSSTPASPSAENVFRSEAVQSDGNVVDNIRSRIENAQNSGGTAPFTDINQHWAEKTIDTFIRLKVIEGYEDGKFKPDGNITRAEFAAIIDRVFQISAGARNSSVVMNDIGNHWAKDVIEKLTTAGILNGYGEEFRPDHTITRAEMVAIISRIVNMNAVKQSDAVGTFTDISHSFAATQIQDAANTGIITGKSGDEFEPEAPSTRAEALTIILNTLNLNPEIKTLLDGSK